MQPNYHCRLFLAYPLLLSSYFLFLVFCLHCVFILLSLCYCIIFSLLLSILLIFFLQFLITCDWSMEKIHHSYSFLIFNNSAASLACSLIITVAWWIALQRHFCVFKDSYCKTFALLIFFEILMWLGQMSEQTTFLLLVCVVLVMFLGILLVSP